MERTESQVYLLDDVIQDNDGECSSGYASSELDTDDFHETRSEFGSSPVPSGSSESRSSPTMTFTRTTALTDSLTFILDMPDLCDVTFLVGKDKVPIHGVKAIVASRSKALYQFVMRHQEERDNNNNRTKRFWKHRGTSSTRLVIKVADYTPEDFRSFIVFLHSGKVKVDDYNVAGLLCASSDFGLHGLYCACVDFLRRNKRAASKEHLIHSLQFYHHNKCVQNILNKIL